MFVDEVKDYLPIFPANITIGQNPEILTGRAGVDTARHWFLSNDRSQVGWNLGIFSDCIDLKGFVGIPILCIKSETLRSILVCRGVAHQSDYYVVSPDANTLWVCINAGGWRVYQTHPNFPRGFVLFPLCSLNMAMGGAVGFGPGFRQLNLYVYEFSKQ